jgi:hypothetical protein
LYFLPIPHPKKQTMLICDILRDVQSAIMSERSLSVYPGTDGERVTRSCAIDLGWQQAQRTVRAITLGYPAYGVGAAMLCHRSLG